MIPSCRATTCTLREEAACAPTCGEPTWARTGAAMRRPEAGPKWIGNVLSLDNCKFRLACRTMRLPPWDSAWPCGRHGRTEELSTPGIRKLGPCTCLKLPVHLYTMTWLLYGLPRVVASKVGGIGVAAISAPTRVHGVGSIKIHPWTTVGL